MRFKVLAFVTIIFSLLACNNEEPSKTTTEKHEVKPQITVPDFNADSAYSYVKAQVDFGPRVPNSEAHTNCANYLASEMNKYADTVYVQRFTVTAFDGTKLKAKNIIAEFNSKQTDRILLFAHWDTRPFADHSKNPEEWDIPIDGANDGASGVGVLMELARNFKQKMPTIGIDIIFFDVEDYGQADHKNLPYVEDSWCLGSQYWAKNKHVPGYFAKYGILLDMVGAKDAFFTKEEISRYFASNVVDKVWNTAEKLGYSNFFLNQKTNPITDDHYYINTIAQIPSIDIIQHDPTTDSGFGAYWHTHNDNMDIIDKTTLKAVGQTLLEVLYNEK